MQNLMMNFSARPGEEPINTIDAIMMRARRLPKGKATQARPKHRRDERNGVIR